VRQFIDEMHLQSVEDLARFDWRSELGAQLTASVQKGADPLEQTQVMSPQPLDNADADLPTQDSSPQQTLPMPVLLAPSVPWPGRRKLLFSVGAVLLLALLLGLLLGNVIELPLIVAAPEPAATPVQAVLLQAPASETVSPDSSRVDTTDVAATAAPLLSPASAPEPVVLLPKPAAAKAVTDSKRNDAPRNLASKAKPQPKPAQAKVPAPPPKDLCAETNFVMRPMCIHLECQKARNFNLPACVDDRKRYPNPGGPPKS
jgi:non-specific serine/threonine protein kinase